MSVQGDSKDRPYKKKRLFIIQTFKPDASQIKAAFYIKRIPR